MVKSPPANAGDVRDEGLIPGSGRCPGGGHGNPRLENLAWRIQWTEEPDGLLSAGSERVRHEWSDGMLVDLSLREIAHRVEWEGDAGMRTD